MVRPKGKVLLRFIEDKKKRQLMFAKRITALTKQIHTFTILCDVEACFFAVGRDGERKNWPEDEEKVQEIVERYRCTEKKKKELNMVDYLSLFQGENKKMVEKELEEIRKENSEFLCYPSWDARFDEVSREELMGFYKFLEEKLRRVRVRKLELMNTNSFLDQQVSSEVGFVGSQLTADFNLDYFGNNADSAIHDQPPPLLLPPSPPPMVESLPELPESLLLPPYWYQQVPSGQYFEGGDNSNSMGMHGSIHDDGAAANSSYWNNPMPLNTMLPSPMGNQLGSVYNNGAATSLSYFNDFMIHQQVPLHTMPMSQDPTQMFQFQSTLDSMDDGSRFSPP